MNHSEEDLDFMIGKENIEVCPGCGSVFLDHQCHANPVRLR